MTSDPERGSAPRRSRAFRGLAIVFLFSFVNLLGVMVTLTALGGFAPWSRWQFVGAFGGLEFAAGLSNVVTPNVWRLPVAELPTSRTPAVQLARATPLLPPLGAPPRSPAGLVRLVFVA